MFFIDYIFFNFKPLLIPSNAIIDVFVKYKSNNSSIIYIDYTIYIYPLHTLQVFDLVNNFNQNSNKF